MGKTSVLMVAVGCLASVTGGLADAQQVPLTIENIQTRNRGVSAAQLSPDGQWLAIVAATDSGRGIFATGTAEGVDTPRLLAVGGSPTWFPDNKRIAYANGGDLWSVALSNGAVGRSSAQPVRLTNDREDERAPVVSPDGRLIAFYSTRSGAQDIWVVSAEGGVPRQVTRQAMALDDARFEPAWSPDSRSIAYISNSADYWADDLWVVDVTSGAARKLSSGLMASTLPAWSPDGKSIALLCTSKRGYWYEDLADLCIVDAATGAERTVAMQIHGTDWLHSQHVAWSADGRTLLFPYQERGSIQLWSVPAAGGVATRLTHAAGSLRAFDYSAASDRLSMVWAGPTEGPDAFIAEGRGGVPRRVSAFADAWLGLAVPTEISFRSHDGLYIQGFLYRPPGWTPTGKYPSLVQVHGGGTNSYLQTLNLLEQYLAQQGYVVLAINYRGGSGFGRAFQDLGVNDWANGQALDAAAAGTFLKAQPWSNGKVGIYGYSYGGIQTMAAIARAPEVFDAAVPMAGIYDFGDAYTNADRLGRIFIKTGHGGAPDERPAVYGVSNTLARLKNIRTPLLVMHGEADVRAPYRQYLSAVDSLRAYGKTFESHSFPGEPHGFRVPANRIELYKRLESFLDRYLRSGVTQ